MTNERELKLALDDFAALRERLRCAGALREHAENLEDNTLWDRKESLRSAGSLLRVRRDSRGSRLTFKGPAVFEDGIKIRAEHETAVADEGSLTAILQALGYAPVRRYQKYREEWLLDDVVVALDRTPMGNFVEFEGEAALAVAARCDCDPTAALAADYLALYDAYREAHPGAPADMLFVDAEGRDG